MPGGGIQTKFVPSLKIRFKSFKQITLKPSNPFAMSSARC